MSFLSELAADNPTHLWHMDSVSGGIIADAGGGTAVDLTVTGSLSSSAGLADQSGALYFGGSDYATGSGSADMPTGNTPYTLGIVCSPSAVTAQQTLVGFGAATLRRSAGIKLNGAFYMAGVWGDDIQTSTVTAVANEKSYLVATYDGGTTLKLYRNGVLIGTRTLGAALNITASAPYVGRLGIGPLGEGYTGVLDEVYIITNTALSAARIAAHYYASSVVERCLYPSFTSSPISPSVQLSAVPSVHYPVHALGV